MKVSASAAGVFVVTADEDARDAGEPGGGNAVNLGVEKVDMGDVGTEAAQRLPHLFQAVDQAPLEGGHPLFDAEAGRVMSTGELTRRLARARRAR